MSICVNVSLAMFLCQYLFVNVSKSMSLCQSLCVRTVVSLCQMSVYIKYLFVLDTLLCQMSGSQISVHKMSIRHGLV